MSEELQKKYLNFPFEIKADAFDESNPNYYEFSGYGSTFGNVDSYNDVVMPGAFAKSIATRMPRMLWSHNRDMPIGKFIEVREDGRGLFLRGQLPKSVSLSRDVGELIKFGAVDSMSIGYRIKQADQGDDGILYLKEVDLMEVSPVAMPANELATITSIKKEGDDSKKSLITIEQIKNLESNRDLEELLRESGIFSKSAAIYLAGRFKFQPRSESVGVGEETFDYKGLHEKFMQMTKLL